MGLAGSGTLCGSVGRWPSALDVVVRRSRVSRCIYVRPCSGASVISGRPQFRWRPFVAARHDESGVVGRWLRPAGSSAHTGRSTLHTSSHLACDLRSTCGRHGRHTSLAATPIEASPGKGHGSPHRVTPTSPQRGMECARDTRDSRARCAAVVCGATCMKRASWRPLLSDVRRGEGEEGEGEGEGVSTRHRRTARPSGPDDG